MRARVFYTRYEEFAGRAHAFTARLPLFYFSASVDTNKHAQQKGAATSINAHKASDTHAQRQAWQQWATQSHRQTG